ncbi:MAG: phosphoribosylanthranilate isomerase [Reichenbachiella sp.]|uniref:phosphoribosylanthranilate isomerase n=1 Tax=Reichenbachiella sp. TaxID=2184521 RepID=UPI0029663955|nr:phosphoribosylanthranilate isomerase [Reichenbachiella sp.]MDW3210743.1 phosphoribosylanthranilate isomerase [Reichenbachiella sp.]
MKIKVCGIRNQDNLTFLNASEVDFIGFIFYNKSKRNFDDGDLNQTIKSDKLKVGVFVNERIEKVEIIAQTHHLDYLQLHGDESPAYCQALKEKGFRLFKAFSIHDVLPTDLKSYEDVVDYFLFDTKGAAYGGNGTQFDWSVLKQYKLSRPFILSGGIGLEDVAVIKKLDHPKLFAVDVNSRFEVSPGQKDEKALKEFIEELKQ